MALQPLPPVPNTPISDDPTRDSIWKRYLEQLFNRVIPLGPGTVTSVAQTVPSEFSVAGSPITTSGTLAITKATQTANTVWAGPTSGGAAQPAFRALVPADLPAGTGTVTSVAQTFTGGLISVAGSPITTSGTLALTVAGTSGGIPYFSGATTWASSGQLANQAIVLGGGAGGAPTGLALGSAHQVIEVNSGATAPQYTSWPTIRRTVNVSETLTVDSNFSLVIAKDLTNNGTVTNNGALAVVT